MPMAMKLTRKSIIVVGHLNNLELITQHFAAAGVPVVPQPVDEALNTLLPKPYLPSEWYQGVNLYIVGDDVSDEDRARLTEWLSEEGGGPYLYVRTSSHPSTLPYHYIEPDQTVDDVVSLLERYLEKIPGSTGQ